MKIKIKVTKSDIKQGIQDDCNSCPVALAVSRIINKDTMIQVEYDTIEFNRAYAEKDNDVKIIPLPAKATKFIEIYDSNEKVKPFSFILNIPASALLK